MPTATPATIRARDGFELAATVHEPDADSRGGDAPAVVVSGATGVKRGYYDRFARFLAERGAPVVVYDYRGIGDSRPKSLRGFPATMRDWGEQDLAGVIDWAGARWPARRLATVGHSVGGQIVGLAPNAGRLSRFLAVAAQSGWWGHWPPRWRPVYAFLWHVAMPALSRVFGYFPSRRLGFGEDLPGGVARQWARWCRNPQYMVDDGGRPLRPHFDDYRGPLLSYSFADDGFAPRPAVDFLAALYRNADRRREHVVPASVGLRSIGHFGFFRDRARPLWAPAAEWLLSP